MIPVPQNVSMLNTWRAQITTSITTELASQWQSIRPSQQWRNIDTIAKYLTKVDRWWEGKKERRRRGRRTCPAESVKNVLTLGEDATYKRRNQAQKGWQLWYTHVSMRIIANNAASCRLQRRIPPEYNAEYNERVSRWARNTWSDGWARGKMPNVT